MIQFRNFYSNGNKTLYIHKFNKTKSDFNRIKFGNLVCSVILP